MSHIKNHFHEEINRRPDHDTDYEWQREQERKAHEEREAEDDLLYGIQDQQTQIILFDGTILN